MPEIEKIGTIELLKGRIFPLSVDDPTTEVEVPAGSFDLLREEGVYYWVMTGALLGSPGGLVRFSSIDLHEKGFADFLADPICTEGHPQQCFRVQCQHP